MARRSKQIGLTISPDGVRYAQLKKKNPDRVLRKGFLPFEQGIIDDELIADEEVFLAELIPWVTKEKLRGQRVIIAIPPSQAIIRRITVASSNAKEIAQLVELEVQTSMHLPFADPVFDYVRVGEPIDDEQEVMIFAAPSQLVASYVRILEEAGLKVTAVDLPALALARMVALKSEEESFDHLMLIDKQGNELNFYLFSEGIPVLMRTITLILDASRLLEGSAAVNNSWLTEEILTEITRLQNFYQFSIHDGHAQIRRIAVIGNHSESELLYNYIREQIDHVIVHMVYVGDSYTRTGTFDYRVPLGLALK